MSIRTNRGGFGFGFRLAVLLGAIAIHAAFGQGAQMGQLSGTIATQTGASVGGGFIVANRVGAGPVTRFQTRSAKDGSFRFSSLPIGNYRLCVQVVGTSLLDPCQWSSPAATVAVTAGRVLTTNVRLQQGQSLSVRLLDDAGALGANQGKGKTQGAHVLVGVWAGGSFHAMRLRSKHGVNWNHDLLVPLDVPLTVTVSSKSFALADAKGAPITAPGGASIPVRIAAGTRPEPIVIRVKGLKQGNGK